MSDEVTSAQAFKILFSRLREAAIDVKEYVDPILNELETLKAELATLREWQPWPPKESGIYLIWDRFWYDGEAHKMFMCFKEIKIEEGKIYFRWLDEYCRPQKGSDWIEWNLVGRLEEARYCGPFKPPVEVKG